MSEIKVKIQVKFLQKIKIQGNVINKTMSIVTSAMKQTNSLKEKTDTKFTLKNR